jgi:hypothetical protein
MAMRFTDSGDIEPFCIDQLPTASLDPSRWPPNLPITHRADRLRDVRHRSDEVARWVWWTVSAPWHVVGFYQENSLAATITVGRA